MKCGDCRIVEANLSLPRTVCDDCWELRGKMVEGMKSGEVSHAEFSEYQKGLTGRVGRGPNVARRILGLPPAKDEVDSLIDEIEQAMAGPSPSEGEYPF